MDVNLINYTGFGHPDPLFAARLLVYTKNTRLTQGFRSRHEVFSQYSEDKIHEELAYIANTIRSSWEFVEYDFEILGVSRAFTHQFVRTRTGSYAQQSQRSVDMGRFETIVPPAVAKEPIYNALWHDLMEKVSETYMDLVAGGVAVQDARGVLPTNVSTNIIAKFNLRTLADLCGKRDNPRAQGEYTAVFKEMAKRILEVHPWADSFLWPERTRTPNLDTILRQILGDSNPTSQPIINGALKELDALKEVWG